MPPLFTVTYTYNRRLDEYWVGVSGWTNTRQFFSDVDYIRGIKTREGAKRACIRLRKVITQGREFPGFLEGRWK